MTTPLVKPIRPEFSSGPCAKRPGWSLKNLDNATLGRSHRHKIAKNKLELAIKLTKSVLEIPNDYIVGIVPGSDTGAIEMAMWNCLGAKPVDILVWDSFGADWANDIKSQLKISELSISKVVPDANWINNDRDGITICDATSAAFAMNIDWSKLDATTFSWQKCLGGEGGHGMIVLSPKAVERINSYNPQWPIPKLFQLKKNNILNLDIFSGSTINTPSMLCVEDYIDALNWSNDIGGLTELIKRSKKNLNIIAEWVSNSHWVDFLSENVDTVSNTSICLKLIDPKIIKQPLEVKNNIEKNIITLLEDESIAFDIGSYRSAPPGLRIWGGPTVDNEDIKKLLPCLDWAFNETIKKLKIV